jgi:hypothetical protein
MMLAQNLEDIQRQALPNFEFAGGNVGDIISSLLPYLFAGAGLLLLLFLLYGGLSLMLSRGDPKAVEAAKGRITGAVIGFVIVFIAYWLVQIIGRILGIGEIVKIFK